MIGIKKKRILASLKPSGLTYGQLVVADGATAYWPMNDAAGSTTVRDVIGTRHATISGGIVLGQPGKGGVTCAVMPNDGLGQIAPSNFPPFNTAVTFEIWTNPTIVSTPTHRVFMARQIATDGDFIWDLLGNTNTVSITYYSTTYQTYNVNVPQVIGTWTHYVMVIANGQMQLFVNGVAQSPQACTIGGTGNAGGARIASSVDAPDWGWRGSVQDAAIYPLALTPAQISAHYAAR